MTTVESRWTEIRNNKLSEFTERYLLRVASESPTVEVCGLITAGGTVLPMRNMEEDPVHGFKMDYDDLMKAMNSHTITGLYHSHPSGDRLPSNLDTLHMGYLYQQGCTWDYYIVAGGVVYLYEHQDR